MNQLFVLVGPSIIANSTMEGIKNEEEHMKETE